MNLPSHQLRDAAPSPILGIHFNAASSTFSTATTKGWVTYRTQPLSVLSRREFANSSLKIVLPLASSNLLFLVGGPPSPLYPPNKVLFWDDKQGCTVAELEFREEVKGLAVRRDRLVVVLRRRVLIFGLGKGSMGVWREGVYETGDNPTGLVALATEEGATLLAFPGRQAGQVQLVHLPPLDSKTPPLPPSPSHDPTTTPFPSFSIILAHASSLSALTTTPSGSVLATTSSKGTLVRIWDPTTSQLVKELRRGTDSAEIFGLALRKDGGAICLSSDKGTVHVWDLGTTREEARRENVSAAENARQKQFNILKPFLPRYFSSEWSHSQFRLPAPAPPPSRLPFSHSSTSPEGPGGRSTPTVEDDVCRCAWIDYEVSTTKSTKGKERLVPPESRVEAQIIALTNSGGWYRISLGPGDRSSGDSFGLGKDSTSDCRLEEYRRFGGDKDGW